MRKINKSPIVPASLRNAPPITCPDDVLPRIYKANDVRDQLMKDQYSKCAYCECKVNKEYNDVEHYRPKSKYCKLGYEWTNLLYACNICNRTCKKDEFPIQNPDCRYEVSLEKPLIINPVEEDPLLHIAFRGHILVPRVVDGEEDMMGKTTIELFQLNDRKKRPVLVAGRERLFSEYRKIMECIRIAETLIQRGASADKVATAQKLLNNCQDMLADLISPSHEYSGMFLGQIDF